MQDAVPPDPDRPPTSPEIRALLHGATAGDVALEARLYKILYAELRRIARALLRGPAGEISIQPTDLVHEAYLRLVGADSPGYADRAHFLAVAARAMRHILVDAARRRSAKKRGGGWQRITLSRSSRLGVAPDTEVLDLHRALRALETRHPRMARVVELRVFAGLTVKETASLLEVSPRTVDVDWKSARLWLAKQMADGDGSPGS